MINKINYTRFTFSTALAFLIFITLKIVTLSQLNYYNVYDYVVYAHEDIFIFFILSLILNFFTGFFKYLTNIVFVFFTLNIIYILEIGYPITNSLLEQASDLIYLQTSVSNNSIKSSVYILLMISAFYVTCDLIISHRNTVMNKVNKKLTRLIFIMVILTSILSGLSYFIKLNERYSRNILVSLFFPPKELKSILSSDLFKKSTYHDVPLTTIGHKLNDNLKTDKNIVLIVVETFTSQLEDQPIEKVLPNITKYKSKSLNFHNHYTSWPFSSKSLYSIICGKYPVPSSMIEMRTLRHRNCESWFKEVSKHQNYDSLVFYTGDLNYDNMNKFFRKQSVSMMKDKNILSKKRKYQISPTSLDDISMVEDFDDYLKSSDKNFISLFITMNSHFPFWTPHKKFKKFKSEYLNSIHYQDHIVGEIVNTLKKNKRFEDTIVIITGDHGKRQQLEAKTLLPKSMFSVPLVILNSKNTGDYKNITNHKDIGNFVINSLNGEEDKSAIFKSKETMVYYELENFFYSIIRNKGTSVLSGDIEIYKNEHGWPTTFSKKCNEKTCSDLVNQYFSYFRYLESLYDI